MDIVRTWPRLDPSGGDGLVQPFTRYSFYPVNRRFVIFKAKSHSDLNLRLALLASKFAGILRHPGHKKRKGRARARPYHRINNWLRRANPNDDANQAGPLGNPTTSLRPPSSERTPLQMSEIWSLHQPLPCRPPDLPELAIRAVSLAVP